MRLTGFQQFSLVILRTLVGWHFAYEGFYKLMLPGWTRDGQRIAAFSAEGYLKGATGPFAQTFQSMAGHPGMMHAIGIIVPAGLLLVGLSLMLGLLGAVLAILSFRTGGMAGLDQLWMTRQTRIADRSSLMPDRESPILNRPS